MSAGWTRNYQYAATGNRLQGTSAPGDPAGTYSHTYSYNSHGSMASMPHLTAIDWDYAERMQHADKGGGGDVYFTYDSAGQRIRKIYDHSGVVEEHIYLSGWEVYRRQRSGTLELKRESLHVMDDTKRIALVETKTVDSEHPGIVPQTRHRYQIDNHLCSTSLELDASSNVISYEEYHPFGTTSFRSADGGAEVSAKRYRYTGKERDDETGLYYYGARYYAAWLGMWTGCDPSVGDGWNLYVYVRNNPVNSVDPDGRESDRKDVGVKFPEGIDTADEMKSYLNSGGTFEYEGREYTLSAEGPLNVEMVDGIPKICGENLRAHEVENDGQKPSKTNEKQNLKESIKEDISESVPVDNTDHRYEQSKINEDLLSYPSGNLSESKGGGGLAKGLQYAEWGNTALSVGFLVLALIPEPTTTAIGVTGLAWTTGAGIGIDISQAATGSGTWEEAAFSAGTALIASGAGKMVAGGMGATAKYSFKAKRFYTVTPTGAWRFEKTARGVAGNQINAVFSTGAMIAQQEKNK